MRFVISRVNQIKQPHGGYVKPSAFTVTQYCDGRVLSESENIHATIISLTVVYLTRFLLCAEGKRAFEIPKKGALIAESMTGRKLMPQFFSLLSGITGIDDMSIVNTCKLVAFDVWYRNPAAASTAKPPERIVPDQDTVENIRIMLERTKSFWNNVAQASDMGFTSSNGQEQTIRFSEGNYLPEDTIWDLKVSKTGPTSKSTLYLLSNLILGHHSGKAEFTEITKLGIFNPRLNRAYTIRVDQIPVETIETVEQMAVG